MDFPDVIYQSAPASEQALRQMESQPVVDPESLTDEVCPVCLEELGHRGSGGPVIRWLGRTRDGNTCGHMMHRECLVRTAQNSHACPVCRAPVDWGTQQGRATNVMVERNISAQQVVTTWPPIPDAVLEIR